MIVSRILTRMRCCSPGFAGGSQYESSGGGADYQCLTLNPEWNNHGDSHAYSSWGKIYGAQYNFKDSSPFLKVCGLSIQSPIKLKSNGKKIWYCNVKIKDLIFARNKVNIIIMFNILKTRSNLQLVVWLIGQQFHPIIWTHCFLLLSWNDASNWLRDTVVRSIWQLTAHVNGP